MWHSDIDNFMQRGYGSFSDYKFTGYYKKSNNLSTMEHRSYFGFVPSDDALAPDNEVPRNYRSYEEAARETCLYILTGKIDSGPGDKQIPPAFTLYRYPSKANQPPWINGKTVGLGFKKTPTSEPVDFIRIDYDPNKGFHFNVQGLTADRTAIDYTKVKLAAKFPSSAKDPDKYFQTLVEPLNRKRSNNPNEYEYSPVNIWDIWKSGRRPSLAVKELEN